MSDTEDTKKPDTPKEEVPPAAAEEQQEGVADAPAPTAEAILAAGDEPQQVESEGDESDHDEEREEAGQAVDHGEEADEYSHEMLSRDLPLKYVLSHIEDSKTGKQLYRDLMIFIPFVIWFVFFAYYRRNTLEGFYTSNALEGLITDYEIAPYPLTSVVPIANRTGDEEGPHFRKVFEDLDNPEDWHLWFQRVMVPVFYNSLSPNAAPSKPGPIVNLNVGALRVRMHRVEDNSCEVNDDLYLDNYTQRCWARFTKKDMLEKPFPFSTASPGWDLNTNTIINIPESQHWNYTDGCNYRGQTTQGWYGRYPCGGFIQDFPANISFNEAMELAKSLEDKGFISHEATRFLTVEFFTYNPSLDIFTSGRMFHEVTPGGGWIPTRRFKSFTVWGPKKYPDGILAFEFIFFIFVLYYFVKFIVNWVRHVKKTGSVIGYIFIFWNFLEFVNIAMFFTGFGLHFEWWRRTNEDLDIDLPNPNLEYSETLNYLMEVYYMELYVLAINMVITFLMIMKYFQMNPRLNILTRTLQASAQSVVGVLVIFLLIVTSYALAGMVLYGHAIYDYRNMSSAFATLFLTLLGEFDYDVIRTEQRGWTFLYFWTFIVVSLFVMLNFITAIIGNGFDEEQAKTKVLPVNVQLRRMAAKMKRFDIGDRWQRIKDAFITRTRRLPDDIIEDHLQELRRTLLMGDRINEEQLDEGEVDEPEYIITRATFDEIIPHEDYENIGALYIDHLYIEMAEDYELFGQPDQDDDEAKISQAYEKGMQEGFINVFVNRKEEIAKSQNQMLLGLVEEDKGQAVTDGRRQSFRRMSSSRLSRTQSDAGSAVSSRASSQHEEEAAPKLSRYELLNKLLGEDSLDDAKLRKREIVDQLVAKPSISGMNQGVANLRNRVAKLESTAEGINRLINLASHKLVNAVEKQKKK